MDVDQGESIRFWQTAPKLGFADQSHLGRQFKQVYGVGPGAYRSARKPLWD